MLPAVEAALNTHLVIKPINVTGGECTRDTGGGQEGTLGRTWCVLRWKGRSQAPQCNLVPRWMLLSVQAAVSSEMIAVLKRLDP